ncbi:hypothetical protein ALQ94_200125 [Pseudomonas amygdali pv. morsprunorum]|uniref:Uncharacterized protein n=1 Tax=Pseudomonas amygdali pv. morsprunorum TaxID=129138 RepID=A0A3M2WED3_PSEA0|nr:hypothetical protein ALQ94_200125 [Pseudomonas amygdali pv. morsprunorum]
MESGKASLAKAILWGQQFVPLGLGPKACELLYAYL